MRLHLGHRGHAHDHAKTGHDERMPSASAYDLFARLFRGSYRRVAADLVEDAPRGGSVLDVGTGPGVLLAAIAERRPDLRVTGVDIDPEMVALARTNLAQLGDRATVVAGSASELPFPDDSFDVVTSSLSLHHWSDPATAAVEFDRVRRPGGRLAVYDLGVAPFDAFTSVLGAPVDIRDLPRVRVTPLPWPALRRLDG